MIEAAHTVRYILPASAYTAVTIQAGQCGMRSTLPSPHPSAPATPSGPSAHPITHSGSADNRLSRPSLARPSLGAVALGYVLVLAGCASSPKPPETRAPATSPPAAASPTAQHAANPASTGAVATAPTHAPATEADHIQGFAQWRDGFAAKAVAAGIRPQTVRDVLGQAQWQPRVIELDRSQPEFNRPPWAYLDSAVSAQRVSQGQAQMAAHRAPLDAAAQRYGVPAHVLTAFWGIESNYGGNFGNFRAVDALATLAYEGRRQAWAQSELLAALRIIDLGDIAPDSMVGSWAGAMGHTQFIPSVFLAHAVDADGDGRRDIWGSIADVLASTANFVAAEGWQAQETWGVEVRLPAGFDHARAELTTRQSSAQWAAEGLQTMDGRPLPALAAASVIEPAGARGPAFLVGQNFRTILRYNNSTSYALAVALLSQRLGGGPGVVASWPRDLQPLSREQTRQLQSALNARGFETGTPDGLLGPATRSGLRQYQKSMGQVADGYPTLDVLQALTAEKAAQ